MTSNGKLQHLSQNTSTSETPGVLQDDDFHGLPGAEFVVPGLKELREGRASECGLLVLIASPRLARLGVAIPIPDHIALPYEHQLYSLLEVTHGAGAHSYYNSLLRRIVSFASALQQVSE
jgi:hypothetical protein